LPPTLCLITMVHVVIESASVVDLVLVSVRLLVKVTKVNMQELTLDSLLVLKEDRVRLLVECLNLVSEKIGLTDLKSQSSSIWVNLPIILKKEISIHPNLLL